MPAVRRWIVPLDDRNTMLIELRHISEAEGVTPARFADREFALPHQIAAPTYEEGQRRPGDYEAQVSQRPIAIHGLKHLGVTDRGVSMFRKMVRQGIRTVRDGGDPKGICHANDGPIPTYCNDDLTINGQNGAITSTACGSSCPAARSG